MFILRTKILTNPGLNRNSSERREGRDKRIRVLAGKEWHLNHPRCQNAIELFDLCQGLRYSYTPG
ncbi:hypothetical protein [Lunatibacter salilacus]|uniref:hypothetical protein n=1 Tax=Lunatibacter salilacus TaxID=2483804 RepID=UPI00131D628B|nr:hypothetical protein [Lunatibacter salilacus]